MTTVSIPGFSEPFNSLSHLIAAGVAFIGSFFLFSRGRGNWLRIMALGAFSFALVFLFSMSGVYHLLEPGSTPRAVFQRLDHAAIWILILGTFIPIHFILFRGLFWRWGFLFILFATTVTGLVLEVIFLDQIPEYLSLSFYIGLGWMGTLSGWKYMTTYGKTGGKLILYGGIAYTIGAIMEFLRWPVIIPGVIGPHEVFHVFIIIAASYHWSFIFQRADRPVVQNLVFNIIERGPEEYTARAVGENITLTSRSSEDLEAEVLKEVGKRFHGHTRPDSCLFKYSKEHLVSLPSD